MSLILLLKWLLCPMSFDQSFCLQIQRVQCLECSIQEQDMAVMGVLYKYVIFYILILLGLLPISSLLENSIPFFQDFINFNILVFKNYFQGTFLTHLEFILLTVKKYLGLFPPNR